VLADSQADAQINRQIEVQTVTDRCYAWLDTYTIVFHRWHISVCVQLIDFGCAISVRESGAEHTASHFPLKLFLAFVPSLSWQIVIIKNQY
jgi:hypothetical protein